MGLFSPLKLEYAFPGPFTTQPAFQLSWGPVASLWVNVIFLSLGSTWGKWNECHYFEFDLDSVNCILKMSQQHKITPQFKAFSFFFFKQEIVFSPEW